MTGLEKKIITYKKLLVDIKGDWEAVQNLVKQISDLRQELKGYRGRLKESDIMAMAAYIHHFYTGIESIFERIAKVFDGGVILGGDYHRELLRSMTMGIPGIRPAIISKDLAEELDEYRRFRHMFRHAYGSELRWRKIEPLLERVLPLMEMLEASLFSYINFVEELIKELQDG